MKKNPEFHGMFRNENCSTEKQYGSFKERIQANPHLLIDTRFVHHEIRGMKKNVTVVMDEETARWVRVQAAHKDLSVSAFLGRVLKKEREKDEGYREAMKRFLDREPRPLAPAGTTPPSRESLHER